MQKLDHTVGFLRKTQKVSPKMGENRLNLLNKTLPLISHFRDSC
jgi:hypothetical protein